MSKSNDCERNLSPLILIGNQRIGTLVKLRVISLEFCPNPNKGNYKDYQTQVRLFPNFTNHHLIAHTNIVK